MEKAQEMPLHFAATSRDSTVLKENDFGSLSLIEITDFFFFPVCENNHFIGNAGGTLTRAVVAHVHSL